MVFSRPLGLAPGALTWDGRNRRAIAAEKKQGYSPRGPVVNRKRSAGQGYCSMIIIPSANTAPRSGRDPTPLVHGGPTTGCARGLRLPDRDL
jgi:hypothetical protein